MADTFQALMIDQSDQGQQVSFKSISDSDLMEGDVTVAVAHSSLNFKDGLAITGAMPVVKKFPMVPGIDFAGTVVESTHTRFKVGNKVLLNGYGTGEVHFGGYAERARVSGDWLVPLPERFTTSDAMAIGTAGYTAMLSVMALERAGVTPDKGDVLVTGASGGVGSVAVSLLAELGYQVVASTGRLEETDFLTSLGASKVIHRNKLNHDLLPMGMAAESFAGAVDSVGSTTLANVIGSIQYGGAVTTCGLAQGIDLPTSVLPFILRSVDLLGIDSVMTPASVREQAWERLAELLNLEKLRALTTHVPLAEVVSLAGEILEGKIRGRVVVDI